MTEQIKLTQITPSLTNPRKRIDPEELEELTASVKEVGIIEPLIVRLLVIKGKKGDYPGNYEIICGERRHRAAEKAGLETVPCDVRDGLTQDEIENLQLHENVHRTDLSPIEECDVFHRLRAKGMTVAEIASRAGKGEGYVQRRLSLVNLTPEIRADHEAGYLSLTATAELARYSLDAQKAIYDELYPTAVEQVDEEDVWQEIQEEDEESDEHRFYNETTQEWDNDAIQAEVKKRLEAHNGQREAAIAKGEMWNKSETRMGAGDIRNWMQNTLSARLDQFAFSMDDDRLRKDQLTCTNCQNRTGLVTGLFDTSEKEEPIRCLDRVCLGGKLDTFIQITRKEIAKKAKIKAEDVPLATKQYRGYGHEREAGLLYTDDFRELRENETGGYYGMCEKAVQVILRDNGTVITVCIKANACEQHFGKARSTSREKAPEGSPLAFQQQTEKRDRKEEIWDVKVGEVVRQRIIIEASGQFAAKTVAQKPWFDLKALIARLWQLTGYNDRGIAKRFLEAAKLKPLNEGHNEDYEAEAVKLSFYEQAQMLFILTHVWKGDMRGGTWVAQEGIKAIATEYGIDYKLTDAQVRLDLSPKKHEKKHKVYLDQVTAKDPAAKLPRVYSESYVCPDDRLEPERIGEVAESPKEGATLNCPDCLMEDVAIVELDENGECPECGYAVVEPEPDEAEGTIADAQEAAEPVLEADTARSVPAEIAEDLNTFFDEAIGEAEPQLVRYVSCGQCGFDGEAGRHSRKCPHCGASTSNVEFHDKVMKEAA